MKQKQLNIFKNFYSIYGLGKKTITNIYSFVGINTKTYPKTVKKTQQKKILRKLNKKVLGKPLKKYVLDRIKFYFEIRSWKGIRHHKNYPIRGQRSHTNAKTKKKLKLFK